MKTHYLQPFYFIRIQKTICQDTLLKPAQPADLRLEPCIPRAQPLITTPLLSIVPRVSRQALLRIFAAPRPVVSLFEKVVIRTARVPNPPWHNQIPLDRPAAAAALELLARRRVDGQRKQVLRLREVCHQAGPGEEVGEADDVDDEDEGEDEVEALLPLGTVARRVLLRADRGVEGVQAARRAELHLFVAPVVFKRGVETADDEG